MRLANSNVVITGASSGIGAALARAVVGVGGRVVLAARRAERLEAVARNLPPGAIAHTVQCDVSRHDQVRQLMTRVKTLFGTVHVLVNNAGVCVYGETERTRKSDFARLINVNLMGAWYGMLEAIPIMRSQGAGTIVNISSVAALHGPPYMGAYAATKAALTSLTQTLRAELPGEIKLMVVYPGYTDTEIFARERQLGGARRPTSRYAAPERVARAIVRGIERGKEDLVLSPEGHCLTFLKRTVPVAVDMIMRRTAIRLRRPDEVSNVQTQTASHCTLSESW